MADKVDLGFMDITLVIQRIPVRVLSFARNYTNWGL
jgi:hypothetical protein